MKVELQNISKRYHKKYALSKFSATLTEGVYGLLGANGAGKTTLINIFVGILNKDEGNILIDGVDAGVLGKEFLAKIGYMPQYPVFYKDFTIMDFLKYMCAIKGIPEAEGQRKACELLDTVNLLEEKDKKIGALSGGMRQRVGIVQAMLGDPQILILDEPTAGLDPQERIRFRNLITKFAKGRIVLLATHIVSDVEFIANEVLVLKEGKLVRKNNISALENEIYGKVWSVNVNDTDIDKYSHYQISNMLRNEDTVSLRIISEECPAEEAALVMPNLEDVFLYYNKHVFGE